MQMTGRLQLTTPSDREVMITRIFEAPRRLVFDAYTKPELIRRWLLGPPGWTMPICEVELRVGGRYRYVWHGPEGATMGMGGVFREIIAPERLASSESFDEDWTGGETLATLVLTEQQGKTLLTQTVLYASQQARDGALATGMTEGMEAGYARLDELLTDTLAGKA